MPPFVERNTPGVCNRINMVSQCCRGKVLSKKKKDGSHSLIQSSAYTVWAKISPPPEAEPADVSLFCIMGCWVRTTAASNFDI